MVHQYHGHDQDTVACVLLSPAVSEARCGCRLAFVTASKDQTCRVWDADSGAVLDELIDVGTGAFTSLAWVGEAGDAERPTGAPSFSLVAGGFDASVLGLALGPQGSLTTVARTRDARGEDEDEDEEENEQDVSMAQGAGAGGGGAGSGPRLARDGNSTVGSSRHVVEAVLARAAAGNEEGGGGAEAEEDDEAEEEDEGEEGVSVQVDSMDERVLQARVSELSTRNAVSVDRAPSPDSSDEDE